jgi:hypothetical protein
MLNLSSFHKAPRVVDHDSFDTERALAAYYTFTTSRAGEDDEERCTG